MGSNGACEVNPDGLRGWRDMRDGFPKILVDQLWVTLGFIF